MHLRRSTRRACAPLAAAGDGTITTQEARAERYGAVKDYLAEPTARLVEETGKLRRGAEEDHALAKSVDFDHETLVSQHADEVAPIVEKLQTDFRAANPAYEEMEGVVAGVRVSPLPAMPPLRIMLAAVAVLLASLAWAATATAATPGAVEGRRRRARLGRGDARVDRPRRRRRGAALAAPAQLPHRDALHPPGRDATLAIERLGDAGSRPGRCTRRSSRTSSTATRPACASCSTTRTRRPAAAS